MCLKEFDTPSDHPAWAIVKPSVAYSDPYFVPYSSILFPSFDEKEYFRWPEKGEENIYEGTIKVEMEAGAKKEAKEEAPWAEGSLQDNP